MEAPQGDQQQNEVTKTAEINAQSLVDSVQGWRIKGFLPKGLSVQGPFPMEIKANAGEMTNYDNDGNGDQLGRLSNRTDPDLIRAYYFLSQLAGNRRVLNQEGGDGPILKELLESDYVFVTRQVKESGQAVAAVSVNFFQNESEAMRMGNRYECQVLQISIEFKAEDASSFVEFVAENETGLLEFLSILAPDLNQKVNKYRATKLRIFNSGFPAEIDAQIPNKNFHSGDLNRINDRVKSESRLVEYTKSNGTVEYQVI